MNRYVLDLHEINGTQTAAVGGKGAHLGELSRIAGVSVPPGFCITTDAYQRVMTALRLTTRSFDSQLNQLSSLKPDDRDAIRTLSADVRRTIESISIPDEIAAAIRNHVAKFSDQTAFAVRSSATAEDLPSASFAGQQDTYLNVVGNAAILKHINRCWGSLFTERALTYRLRNGFDHRKVHMAVVIQQMVFPTSSGILFTADPISGNRKISTIDASFGLGEALVSGLVNPDVYKVQNNVIVAKNISNKTLSIEPLPTGGTEHRTIELQRQRQPAMTDAQVLQLVKIGRDIETHFRRPQDIEWCLADDQFEIVQSRPITTLFPPPPVTDDENHVYLSVGHQQMMTDAMRPLGISMWQLATPRPMAEAGGRLFVEVTGALASPASRTALLGLIEKSDPLTKDALQSILDRPDFIRTSSQSLPAPQTTAAAIITAAQPPVPIETDPAIVTALIQENEQSIAALEREIKGKSGTALLDCILDDIKEHKRILFNPESHKVFMSAIEATWWLNDRLLEWLGEKNAADSLAQSVPNNVTSEMGLALLDVADVIRSHPEVVSFLESVRNDDFRNQLTMFSGGAESLSAIDGWLSLYGMRGVGEIDITRDRWSERPTMLVPLLLGNVKNFKAGASRRLFEQGLKKAQAKEREIITRLRELPDGEDKAREVKQKIDRVRTFIGYREYPKYGKIWREFVYKNALMEEAERLVQAGVIRAKEDIFYLRIHELQEVVRTQRADYQLIENRKEEFKSDQILRPPRVLTSDGEAVNGSHRREGIPAGALVGTPVSSGTVEGRARVILDLENADIEPGDILVTAFTDPSWTPLFVAISGLVTEVGGLMTHGAVIAREYGLPAIVGVENATRLIRDGQRVRVHGTDGYVEFLD